MKANNHSSLWVTILIAILNFSPSMIQAQVSSLHKGDIIRIVEEKYFHSSVIGKLDAVKKDSIVVQIESKKYTIAVLQITKLEVAKGKKRTTRKGAIIGAISGGLGVGLLSAIAVSQVQSRLLAPTPGQAFLGGMVYGALAGGGIGALVGSQTDSYIWMEIQLQN